MVGKEIEWLIRAVVPVMGSLLSLRLMECSGERCAAASKDDNILGVF